MANRYNPDELRRLRWEAMAAGNFPEILNTEEAAFFLRRSVSWLLKSDVPRSFPPGRGKGVQRDPIFLKSQLILYAEKHLDRRLDEIPRARRVSR
jgi:hypothetical protein